MQIYGVDFTSAPRRGKSIAAAVCDLAAGRLTVARVETLETLEAFEALLARPGPWVVGLDFPFGQPRRLVEALGWPLDWAGYVVQGEALGMEGFVARLADYRAGQPPGDKQHQRQTDARAGSASPMMLYGVPVGRMFLRGAPCLYRAGVSVLPNRPTESDRVVIEAYPALAARRWIGRTSYKSDTRSKQTAARRAARQTIVDGLRSDDCREVYGFDVVLSDSQAAALIDEPQGDVLDSLLAALPAAWAWTRRDSGWGIPPDVDPLEGWIVDPGLA